MGILAVSQLVSDIHGTDPARRDANVQPLFDSMTDCLRSSDEFGSLDQHRAGMLLVDKDLFGALCRSFPCLLEPLARTQDDVRGSGMAAVRVLGHWPPNN